MDSIFDYLVILFFVISGLSSLLKKKKDEARKKDLPMPDEVFNTSSGDDYSDDFDPVESDFDPFERIDVLQQEKVNTYSTSKSVEFIDPLDSVKKKAFEDISKNYDVVKSSVSKTYSAESLAPEKEKALNILANLQRPNSFREAFIMSELLREPLSLREDV